MATYTVTLSEADTKSLEYAAVDPQAMIENWTLVRANKAKGEIINLLMDHCNANGIQLAVGVDAQVSQAYELGVVKSLQAAHLEELERVAAQEAQLEQP